MAHERGIVRDGQWLIVVARSTTCDSLAPLSRYPQPNFSLARLAL